MWSSFISVMYREAHKIKQVHKVLLTNLELAEFSCAIEKIQIVRKKPEKYMD